MVLVDEASTLCLCLFMQLRQEEEGLAAQVAGLKEKKTKLQEKIQGAQEGREGGVRPKNHCPHDHAKSLFPLVNLM